MSNFRSMSTEELVDELDQARKSSRELADRIFAEGDGIVGADTEGDVYLSDMYFAVADTALDISVELKKRKQKEIQNV